MVVSELLLAVDYGMLALIGLFPERDCYLSFRSTVKEGRFVLGTFRSERNAVLNQSRQNDRLRVILVLVHTDITPSHTPLPVFRRIGERTIPYSWRACKQLRYLCETALRSNGLFASMFDGLIAFAVDRWRHDCGARRVRFRSRPGSPMKEGRFVLGTFRSEQMRVLNRSRQNDRLRVMLVLVHIDITPLQQFISFLRYKVN
ncbi:uncharacterized protein TNCV_5040721 [Trichonephila clavipes]|nr:uncharacterized protein TNCV_5040721 [Trichonephila clavipes]